jgi:hypothetical protein
MSVRAADDWGVFVDEVKLFAVSGEGAGWWALYSGHQPAERLTCLRATLGGSQWHVACDSQDDAEMLLATMTERGVHPKCAQVSRLSACRKVAAR